MIATSGEDVVQKSHHSKDRQQNFLKKFEKSVDMKVWVVYTNEAVAESDGGTLKTS